MQREIETTFESEIVSRRPLSGGDVAMAYQLTLADNRVIFAKTRAGADPGFFATEALCLAALRSADELPVPEVLHVGVDEPLLVLEWIDEASQRPSSDYTLGSSLARLHRSGAEVFGRADRRPTGSRGLPNEPCDSWAESYATNRLLPLAKLATDSATLPSATVEMLESIASRLTTFGAADEPAALLHGDLWAGNRVIDSDGQSWLIDPAVHGGHREFDLAMMQLFGGWQPNVFDGYHDAWPLADGWQERVALHQLAPLAVHAIKFGGGYAAATTDAARRYM